MLFETVSFAIPQAIDWATTHRDESGSQGSN